MRCQEARKWLSPYLDSELDPTKTFEVSQHLEQCDRCRDRFEKEARADGLITTSLRREERYVDWSAIERQILAPARRVIPLRPRWLLAAAACIGMLLIFWPDRSIADVAATKWAADELSTLSPACEPFAVRPGCGPARIVAVAEEVLDCKVGLSFADGELGDHRLTLCQVNRRTADTGSDRVQVQLNCCDFPVLLVIGRCSKSGALAGLTDALEKSSGEYAADVTSHDFNYHFSALKKGDYVVVAISPHDVKHLLSRVALPAG